MPDVLLIVFGSTATLRDEPVRMDGFVLLRCPPLFVSFRVWHCGGPNTNEGTCCTSDTS